MGSLNPSSAVAGGAAFTLTVTGTNFVSTSTVQWNGNARTTTSTSSTSLQAAITAADIAAAGTAMVSVATPAPGGGTSSALTFAINKPIPVVAISPASATVAAGGQQQFTANVRNSLNLAVTWEVNGISGGNATVGMISNAGLYIAPTAQASVTISAVSQADAHQSASATLSVLAPHPIGVRPTAAIAEFFNRNTGNVFVPRGNNYIRLANLTDDRGNLVLAHSTFVVGLYDANRAETALASMQSSGYNIVTIIMEGCCQGTIGDGTSGGDPFELGSARPLDFGHWAAHKLESMTHHRLRHGEAVAIGLAIDTTYAELAGVSDAATSAAARELLGRLGLPRWDDALELRVGGRRVVLDGLGEFREHLGGELTITLARRIGEGVEVHAIDESLMDDAIARLRPRA